MTVRSGAGRPADVGAPGHGPEDAGEKATGGAGWESASEVERRIEELAPWFHNLHLPDGRQTAPDHPLGDFPAYKWRRLAPHLPRDMSGWRALDVGCNAGFYAFELARRGADVTGIDVDGRYLRQARWAATRFRLPGRVRFRRRHVYELAEEDAPYDLVLFLGVFYHLRYPLLALDLASRLVRRRLVFQSLTMPGDEVLPSGRIEDRPLDERDAFLEDGWPKMAFVEGSFAGDPTNWWIPNLAAVEALLRSCGLEVVARPEREIFVCEPGRGSRHVEGHVSREEELRAAAGRRAATEAAATERQGSRAGGGRGAH